MVALAVEAVASTVAPVVVGFMAAPVLVAVADPAVALEARVEASAAVRALAGAAFMVVPVGAAGRAVVFIAVAAAGAVVAGGAAPVGAAGVTPATDGDTPVMAGAMVSGVVPIGAVAGAGVRPLPLALC